VSQAVSPQSIEELQHVFRTSSDTGRPIYVYRKSNHDGLTIDLAKLDKIIEIDAANLVATVGPGVKLGKLAERLAEQGLRFIPADTPFYHDTTVGQLFYQGCSNLSSLKYGYTKHFLMGSEIVLPTGEVLKAGGKTVKNVTGYDFTRFFNAPYTDYGVTAKFLLKLLPLPETRKNIGATFTRLEEMLLL
jgi:glycolate oxidase